MRQILSHCYRVINCCLWQTASVAQADVPDLINIISTRRSVQQQQLIQEYSLCAKFCLNECCRSCLLCLVWCCPPAAATDEHWTTVSPAAAVTSEQQLHTLNLTMYVDCCHCAEIYNLHFYCVIDCLTNTVVLLTVYPTLCLSTAALLYYWLPATYTIVLLTACYLHCCVIDCLYLQQCPT